MFFHDPVPEMESVMLIKYALQFEARLLRQVKGPVTIAFFELMAVRTPFCQLK